MKKLDNTAERTALWRALHLETDAVPLIIKDLWALKLTRPAPGWQQRPDMKFTKPIRASIVGRARFVEDQVIKAHEGLEKKAKKGINQYVILGAGLDSFALRYQSKADLPPLQIFEIDQPGTLQWKTACIKEQIRDLPSNLHLIPMDFEAAMQVRVNNETQEGSKDNTGDNKAAQGAKRKPAPATWLEALVGTAAVKDTEENRSPTKPSEPASAAKGMPGDQQVSVSASIVAAAANGKTAANMAFDLQKPAIISCTGVTLYLTLPAIKEMLGLIAGNFAPGSQMIISFYEPPEALEGQDRKLLDISIAGAADSGTPMISFFREKEVLALAGEAGLKQAQIYNTRDLINLYFAGRTDDLLPNKGELFLVAST